MPHTKLPWRAEKLPAAEPGDESTHRVIALNEQGNDTRTVAFFGGPDAEDNAQLTALAPAMLEFLRYLAVYQDAGSADMGWQSTLLSIGEQSRNLLALIKEPQINAPEVRYLVSAANRTPSVHETVEGALHCARSLIYMNPAHMVNYTACLQAGMPVHLCYGFSSVQITPLPASLLPTRGE